VLVIPATSIGLGRLFQTNDDVTRKALDVIAANPDKQFMFALLGYIGILTIVPAFLAAARCGRQRGTPGRSSGCRCSRAART